MSYQPPNGEVWLGQDTTLCQTISLWGTQRFFPVHVQRKASHPNETSREKYGQNTMLQKAEVLHLSENGIKFDGHGECQVCNHMIINWSIDFSLAQDTQKQHHSFGFLQARRVSAGKLVASCNAAVENDASDLQPRKTGSLPSYWTHLVTPVPPKLRFRANGKSQVTGLQVHCLAESWWKVVIFVTLHAPATITNNPIISSISEIW